MVIDALLFPIYCILILILGLGFKRIGFWITGIKVSSQETWLLLLFGQFAIGLISLIVNFFSGVNTPLTFFLIAAVFVLGIIDIRTVSYKSYLLLAGISILLVPLAANLKEGYDGGLYHLPHQLWIRNEKIVFGLANFHGRFGFGSIQEYISAPQWIGENFKLLSYSTVVYPLAFLVFLWNWLSQKENYKLILVGLMIISILTFKSFMMWYYTHTDNSSGFIFVLCLLFGFQTVRNSSSGSVNVEYELFVLTFLALFSWFLKLSGIVGVLWLLYVFFVLLKRRLVTKTVTRVLGFFMTIMAIWFLKGIITTGCLLYPVAETCLNVQWSAKWRAISDSNWITAWARHPGTRLTALESWDWLGNWWLDNYEQFLMNFSATLFGLVLSSLLIQLGFVRKLRFDHLKFAALLILLISLALWFFKAPVPRFGTGVFLILPAFCAFSLIEEDQFRIPLKWFSKFILKPALILLAIFSFGWSSKNFKKSNLLKFNELKVTAPEVEDDAIYGKKPSVGDRCWLVPHCSPQFRYAPEEVGGYKFFEKAKIKRNI